MKKQDLLKIVDQELLDKLFGFCYARTSDSREAQELCSDIMLELVKAANAEGEIRNLYGFLWRIARNKYADFSEKKRRQSETSCEGDPEDVFRLMASPQGQDDTQELLKSVYRQIAFLTKAYREAMVLYYLDGLSVAEVARRQNTSQGAVQQRLFSARKRIRSEVEEMEKVNQKPIVLDKLEFYLCGSGSPGWSDPRTVCTRQFSKHLVWLCRKKSMTAAEAAQELHVPTVYVEEEMEILRRGENGLYGLLRRMDNGESAAGKYAINFILLDQEEIRKIRAAYEEQIPAVCQVASEYLDKHKDEYLAFPYLNKRIDWNLILWQQISEIPNMIGGCVCRILSEKHFAQVKKIQRPFHVCGCVDDGRRYGTGVDGVEATNVCGYSWMQLVNMYNRWMGAHFNCYHNVSRDPLLQLTLRAVDGLAMDSLSDTEKEHAAKAIECGYLYRDGEHLYTKILVNSWEDQGRLYEISHRMLTEGHLAECAEAVAEKVSSLIRRYVPEHLLGEWEYACILGDQVIFDALVEEMIDRKLLTPPKNRLDAEGCWMCVKKQ